MSIPIHEKIYETIIAWDEGEGGKRSRRELTRRIEAILQQAVVEATDGLAEALRQVFESAHPYESGIPDSVIEFAKVAMKNAGQKWEYEK